MSATAPSAPNPRRTSPRSLTSLAELGTAEALKTLLDAVRAGATVPGPSGGHQKVPVRVRTPAAALGEPPRAWLAALERAGWALASADSPPDAPPQSSESLALSEAATLELVYGAHFAPRRTVEDKRATRWSRLAREDPLATRSSATARLNLGGVVHDPLPALAYLTNTPANFAWGAAPVAVIWCAAMHAEAPAPVAWVHSLLEGLALLGAQRMLVAQPEGFELYPAVLAATERLALTRHACRVEAAYTAEQTRHWLQSNPGAIALPVPWYPLRYYDDLDAGQAAARNADPHTWRDAATAADEYVDVDHVCNDPVAAFAAAFAWCLPPPSDDPQ